MDGHARQADPRHGTDDWWLRADNGLERRLEWHGHACGGLVVAGSGDGGGGSRRQGTAGAELGGGGGGGKAFGTVTGNEASPLPLNKALKGS